MLAQARNLRDEGADVVIAVVESHGRPATAALVEGLEVIPRIARPYRGSTFDEMFVGVGGELPGEQADVQPRE